MSAADIRVTVDSRFHDSSVALLDGFLRLGERTKSTGPRFDLHIFHSLPSGQYRVSEARQGARTDLTKGVQAFQCSENTLRHCFAAVA